MKVYVDTEFISKTFPKITDPSLLSAGFVTDDGRSHYVEIHNPRLHSRASAFVQDTVLSQFGRFPESAVGSVKEAGRSIADFLDQIEGDIVLCADFPVDLYLVLDALLQAGRLEELQSRISTKDLKAFVIGDEMNEEWENAFALQGAQMGLDRHHALLDAHCLKTVYLAAIAAKPAMDQARHDYHLSTAENGKIVGRAWTNDNDDKGYPSSEESWDVSYKNLERAMEDTGGTHVGMNGCQVNVYLDGSMVDRQGKRFDEPRRPRMRP